MLPTREEFPYAIRQVSEALSSNGSTSMGSVCASTLSLLNAGVPLRAPVAGIAMGLVSDTVDGETSYAALTDILGAEDAFGDMDFKVAGTSEFVTAIQLDTKLDGIPASVLARALTQARDARLHILDVMAEAIDRPDEMSPYAPRVISLKIPVDQIGAVIGPKGKIINQIQEDTGADVSVEDDGTIYIGATDGPSAEAARAMINAIANPTMPEVGERYMGTVVKTTTFGAFVSLVPGKDGLLHISQIRKMVGGKRVENVEDVLAVGQKVQVADLRDRPARQAVARPGAAGGRGRATPRRRPVPSSSRRRRTPDVTAACQGRPPAADPLGVTRADRRRGGGRRRRAPFRPPRRRPGPHRGDAGPALGHARLLARRGLAGRGERSPRLHALPRAPAVQGHGAALGHGHRDRLRRRRRRGERGDRQGAHLLLRPGARRRRADGRRRPARHGDRAPASTAGDVESERGVILEELAMNDDDPADVVHERFAELVLRRAPAGPAHRRHRRRRSQAVGRGDITAHYREHYTPPGWSSPRPAGSTTTRSCAAVTEQLAGSGWRAARRAEPRCRAGTSRRRHPDAVGPGGLLVVRRPTEQANVVLGTVGLTANDERRYVMSVLNAVLGGGMSSRLFQEIRERRGLAYSVYSFASGYSDAGWFGLYAGCTPAKTDEVVRLLAAGLEELAERRGRRRRAGPGQGPGRRRPRAGPGGLGLADDAGSGAPSSCTAPSCRSTRSSRRCAR